MGHLNGFKRLLKIVETLSSSSTPFYTLQKNPFSPTPSLPPQSSSSSSSSSSQTTIPPVKRKLSITSSSTSTSSAAAAVVTSLKSVSKISVDEEARTTVQHTHVITQIYQVLRTYLEILPVLTTGEEPTNLDQDFNFDVGFQQHQKDDASILSPGPKIRSPGTELHTELPIEQLTPAPTSMTTPLPIPIHTPVSHKSGKEKDGKNKKGTPKEKSQKEKNDKSKIISSYGEIAVENSELKNTVSSNHGNLLPISTLLNTEKESEYVFHAENMIVKQIEIMEDEMADLNLKSFLRKSNSETVNVENTDLIPGTLDLDSRLNSRIGAGTPMLLDECSSSATSSSSSSSSSSCSDGLNKIGVLEYENMNRSINVSTYNDNNNDIINNNDTDIDIEIDNNENNITDNSNDNDEKVDSDIEIESKMFNNKPNLTVITPNNPLTENLLKSLNNNDNNIEENNYVEVENEEDMNNFDLLVLPYKTLKNEEERIKIAVEKHKNKGILSFSTALRRNKNYNGIPSNLICGENNDNVVEGCVNVPYGGASFAYVLRDQMLKQVFLFVFVFVIVTILIMIIIIIVNQHTSLHVSYTAQYTVSKRSVTY